MESNILLNIFLKRFVESLLQYIIFKSRAPPPLQLPRHLFFSRGTISFSVFVKHVSHGHMWWRLWKGGFGGFCHRWGGPRWFLSFFFFFEQILSQDSHFILPRIAASKILFLRWLKRVIFKSGNISWSVPPWDSSSWTKIPKEEKKIGFQIKNNETFKHTKI